MRPTYIYLSELSFIVPVWDPNGYLTRRKELVATYPEPLRDVLDMVQIVFALNRTYFTGDKKLENAMTTIPLCPELLKTNLAFLLSSARDCEILSEQRDILRTIRDELKIMIQQNR